MDMPLHPSWPDIAVRLVLTVLAGAIVGINREAGGHSAGFRTTVLVSLAAALSMIQADILLGVGGKSSDSFAVMDVMRLPLGILTGMGFIGGGAILKRGNLVSGVTTAATLWAMTMIGLCFGGGQLILGCVGTAVIFTTLVGFKWVDLLIPRQRRANVVIAGASDTPSLSDIYSVLTAAGYRANFVRQSNDGGRDRRLTTFEVRWDQPEIAGPPHQLLNLLRQSYDVEAFDVVVEGTH